MRPIRRPDCRPCLGSRLMACLGAEWILWCLVPAKQASVADENRSVVVGERRHPTVGGLRVVVGRQGPEHGVRANGPHARCKEWADVRPGSPSHASVCKILRASIYDPPTADPATSRAKLAKGLYGSQGRPGVGAGVRPRRSCISAIRTDLRGDCRPVPWRRSQYLRHNQRSPCKSGHDNYSRALQSSIRSRCH